MSKDLVEAIARAMAHVGHDDKFWLGYSDQARAALAAIEEAGFRVVPVEPTERIIPEGKVLGMPICCQIFPEDPLREPVLWYWIDGKWQTGDDAVVSAAPKQG